MIHDETEILLKTLKYMRKIDEHHHISLVLGHIFKDNEGIYILAAPGATRVAFSRSSTKTQFEEWAPGRPIARRPRPLIDTDFTTPPPFKKKPVPDRSVPSRGFVPCRPIRV